MALNLRTITPELHAALKASAARYNVSLENYVLDILHAFVFGTGKPADAPYPSPATRPAKIKAERKPVYGPSRVEAALPALQKLDSLTRPSVSKQSSRPAHAIGCKCGMCAAIKK